MLKRARQHLPPPTRLQFNMRVRFALASLVVLACTTDPHGAAIPLGTSLTAEVQSSPSVNNDRPPTASDKLFFPFWLPGFGGLPKLPEIQVPKMPGLVNPLPSILPSGGVGLPNVLPTGGQSGVSLPNVLSTGGLGGVGLPNILPTGGQGAVSLPNILPTGGLGGVGLPNLLPTGGQSSVLLPSLLPTGELGGLSLPNILPTAGSAGAGGLGLPNVLPTGPVLYLPTSTQTGSPTPTSTSNTGVIGGFLGIDGLPFRQG